MSFRYLLPGSEGSSELNVKNTCALTARPRASRVAAILAGWRRRPPERSEGSCAGRRGRDASAVVPGGAWNPVAPDPNVGVSGLELGGLLLRFLHREQARRRGPVTGVCLRHPRVIFLLRNDVDRFKTSAK